MNELELISELRADAPRALPPGLREVVLQQTVLRRAAGPDEAEPRSTARAVKVTKRGTVGWVASAATACALGAVGFVVLQSGPGAAPSEAAVVLNRAALALADENEPKPDSDQWLYRSSRRVEFGETFNPSPKAHPHGWVTFDGRFYVDPDYGDLTADSGVHAVDPESLKTNFDYDEAWDAAEALPTESSALLLALNDSELADPEGNSQAARDYDAVTDALSSWLLPRDVQANLYTALATIPGVGIDTDAEADLLGRPVVAITFEGEAGESLAAQREILLDPTSFVYRGQRERALESGRDWQGRAVEAGDVSSVVRIGPIAVDRPGQRP